MAAMAGILNHPMTAGQALTGSGTNPMSASPAATSGTSSTSSSGSSSATISANDFLTLLVTEMQNQDPTADTDPNEYINQLVQVNSLEQLIDINQNLSTALGSSGTASGTSSASGQATSSKSAQSASGPSASGLTAAGPAGATQKGSASAHAHKAGAGTGAKPGGSRTAAAISQFAQSVGAKHAPGNLSTPEAKPAAHRVAHALDGHSHALTIPGKQPGGQSS
jgi:flagellar basal-body rod modification protein FlgD